MPTIIDLGRKVKLKYPGTYDSLSDEEVGRRIKLKYPTAYNDFSDVQQIKQPIQKNTSLLSSINQSAINRGANILETTKETVKGKINPLQTGINVVGQGAGFIADIVGNIFNKGIQALPEQVKKPVADTINNLANTMVNNPNIYKGLVAVNEGIDKYNNWAKKNPENAKTVEGLVNIAMLAPISEGSRAGLTDIGGKAGIAGRVLEKSGLEALNTKKQSFVRNLIKPIQTKAVKEAQVARTTETGMGIFKKSIIAPTSQELKAENAVMKIEGVKPNNTFQQNYNIIHDANVAAAKQLEADIAKNDFIISKKEVISTLNKSKINLTKSPTIVGDAQKIADKLLNGAIDAVNKNKGTGSGILQARKDYDAWVLSQKPKAFDAVSDNAFSIANREVRNTLNDILDRKATSVAVKEQLSNQSSLFNALDTIKTKAAQEADTAFGRLLQDTGKLLGTKNKIVQGLAAAAGIGGLGAAATFAPVAAVIGGLSLLVYKGGKLVLNPQIRIQLGKVLQEIERVLPTAQPAKKIEFNSLKEQIKNIINSEEGFVRYGSGDLKVSELNNNIKNIENLMSKTTNENTLRQLDNARKDAIKLRQQILK